MAAFAEVAQSWPQAPARSRRAASRRTGADLPRPDPGAAQSLAALISGEIVPRLMLAHGLGDGAAAAQPGAPTDLDVDAFTPLTLAADPRPLLALVDRLLADGTSVDTLMIDLLAPAARLLGTWWDEDRCDFIEVTMGLWRLQEVVREISARTVPAPARPGRRALFAAFPGDQHDFGAVMTSEFFLRHGWAAEMIVAPDMAALLAAVAQAEYDVVGLTLNCDCHSARLPSAILALRSVSRNPQLRVMIGGPAANADPALAERAGADGTASDAREALHVAEALTASAAHSAACC